MITDEDGLPIDTAEIDRMLRQRLVVMTRYLTEEDVAAILLETLPPKTIDLLRRPRPWPRRCRD
jgi:hypothetical protein